MAELVLQDVGKSKSIDNKTLYDTFCAFGNILSYKFDRNSLGESMEYAFVQFEMDESAQSSFDKLNGMLLNDKKVTIRPFVRKQDWEKVWNSITFSSSVLPGKMSGQWPIGHLLASENLRLVIPVLQSLGNPVIGDGYMVDSILIVGNSVTDQVLSSLIKRLKSDNKVLKKEVSWAMSNIAASSFEHKKRICASEATLLLMHLLRTTNFDIHREAAYTLGNLCVVPAGSSNPLSTIMPPNEAVQLAAKYHEQGSQTLNLKVGKNFNSDIEVLAAIQLDHPDCSFILDANEEYTYGSFSFIGLDTNTLYEMVCPYYDSGFVAELDDANALMSHFDGMDPDFHHDPRFEIMEVISVVMQHDMAGVNKEVNVTGRSNSFSDLEIEFVIKRRDNPPMSLEALLETISCLPVQALFVYTNPALD